MAREPIHPGEILADELTELNISSAELARQINVPANRISQIISGKKRPLPLQFSLVDSFDSLKHVCYDFLRSN